MDLYFYILCICDFCIYLFIFFTKKNSASKSFLKAMYKNVKTKANKNQQKPCVSERAV